MSDDLLDRAKAAMEGVTPGPWQADSAFCEMGHEVRIAMPDRIGIPMATIAECFSNFSEADEYGERRISWKEAKANAHFIAASRSLVPEMADRIEALTAEVARLTADKRMILEERDRTFALMLSRAEAAEAKLAQGVRVKPGYRVDAYDLTMGGKTVPLDRAIDAVPAAQIADEALERAAQVADEWFRNLGKGNPGDEIRALKGTMK